MNQKTAKLLRKLSSVRGEPYRDSKREWISAPKHARGELRSEMVAVVSFATKIKAWRGKRLQKEAADALGVPFDTYRNWEYGRNIPLALSMVEIERRMTAAE